MYRTLFYVFLIQLYASKMTLFVGFFGIRLYVQYKYMGRSMSNRTGLGIHLSDSLKI